MRPLARRGIGVLLAALFAATLFGGYRHMLRPATDVPPTAPDAEAWAEIERLQPRLEAHVTRLAGEIGPRHVERPGALAGAAAYIRRTWEGLGYRVRRQRYTVRGVPCDNLEIEIPGSDAGGKIVVVGAHYDTAIGTGPGADDNASGVAALLEIARMLRGFRPRRTLRLVAFVNEEPPFFLTDEMGSRRYAARARGRGERISAMLSLETIGYYSDAPGSQRYPFPLRLFYPDRGNFLAAVGNLASRDLVRDFGRAFRAAGDFPLECAALPGFVAAVDWSDHGSFWHHGYPALMLTDTALFRYPHYHASTDTPDRLDYGSLARVTHGVAAATRTLAGEGQ